MSEKPKVGVYVCHCGLNIAGTVNVEEVVRYASTLPDVVVAKNYVFMCSAPGQETIKDDIQQKGLNRVVVASCSPTMHEATFRGALSDAGLNPYLLEMANIREHCSWVHPDDKAAATEKAKDLVRMAVAKARLLEPLKSITFTVQPSVLVLGGGVAGLSAALDLAHIGLNIFLVEKSPTLGGRAAQTGWLTHTEGKGADVVKHMVSELASNSRVQILTNAELVSIDGSVGNFKARVRVHPRYVNEKCTLCDDCTKVCPIEVTNEYEYGLNKRKAVFLPFEDAFPHAYIIDNAICIHCNRCVEACRDGAIDFDEKPVEIDLNAGGIILATGYDPYIPPKGEYGYGLNTNVVTLFQLERMLDNRGPTEGRFTLNGRTPKRIAFITCVGSLGTTKNAGNYCSRMCCTTTLRNALKLKEMSPDADIWVLYKNMTTYGRGDERLYENAASHLVNFVRFDEAPRVNVGENGLSIDVFETTIQENLTIPVEAVILSVGMVPRIDSSNVRRITRATCGTDGFLREAHLKLRPVETPTDGIYLAGTVTGPRNIIESVMAGSAAAAKAAGLLVPGKVQVEPIVAEVNEEQCSGCEICVGMCPYGAITMVPEEDKRLAVVESALCKGCGVCVAACPSGALRELGYTDQQLTAQVLACMITGGKSQ